jgi:carbon-monoxide dehydrogenase medium subunit
VVSDEPDNGRTTMREEPVIPAPFTYHRPADVAGALKLLAEHGDAARVVAGGHSLIPMMKLRLAPVEHLVDLQAVSGLRGIEVGAGSVRIGAMVTQAEILGHAALARAVPLLAETAAQIADPQVRNMGTLGGNVANGDPGNDMPAVMQCLDAVFELQGPRGRREVAARSFYEGAYVTARGDDEILVAVRLAPTRGGAAYEKQKRKIGDYATAAAAVVVEKSGGICSAASIAMTNLADTPVWCEAAGAALIGTPVDAAAVAAAVTAMQAAISPNPDNRGPVEFKRHAAGAVLKAAIARAWSRA